MKELRIWLTYHDDKQIQEFGLKETETIHLFKGNDVSVDGESINHLNRFYSELTTMYYVWKNKIESRQIGFCHYRRMFDTCCEFEVGQCQVLLINYNNNIFANYKMAHNYQDMYDIIEIMNDKYGEGNKYSEYMLKSHIFIPCCCFIMHWVDFNKLCKWLFPILFSWDKKNGLGMSPEKYMEKAKRDFRFDNVDYQCRAIAFLSERLISCYLVTEMKPFCLTSL